MKNKFIFTIMSLVLFGCVTPVYYPYEGNKTVVGEGGFVESVIPSDFVKNNFFFSKRPDYKYDHFAFYMSGLPSDKKCTLIGYVADKDYLSIAKFALELDGNAATKSSVSFPVKFSNSSGVLGAVGSTDDWYNGYGEKVAKGYNIFECK